MQVWCSHYETRCVFVSLDGPVVLFDYANHPYLADGIPTSSSALKAISAASDFETFW